MATKSEIEAELEETKAALGVAMDTIESLREDAEADRVVLDHWKSRAAAAEEAARSAAAAPGSLVLDPDDLALRLSTTVRQLGGNVDRERHMLYHRAFKRMLTAE